MNEEELKLRQEIAAEQWGEDVPDFDAGAPPSIEDDVEAEEVAPEIETSEAEPEVVDPWSGLPDVVKQEIEGLRSKVSVLDQIEYRLKQAESRVGGLTNELHAAKEASKQVSEAPTAKQIAESSGTQEAWDALKDDFPEWAEATNFRLAAQRAEIVELIPDVEKLLEQAGQVSDKAIVDLKEELNETLVEIRHPDWLETINTEAFNKWWSGQGKKDAYNARGTIKILDEYVEYRASLPSAKDTLKERKQRLGNAELNHNKTRVAPAKSEDDMTTEELRASIAAKYWQ